MTPIERAARALCELKASDGFPLLNADPDFGDYPLTDEGTDEDNPFTEADVIAMVRAVIAAIREPSEAMMQPDRLFSHFYHDADGMEDNA